MIAERNWKMCTFLVQQQSSKFKRLICCLLHLFESCYFNENSVPNNFEMFGLAAMPDKCGTRFQD